MQLIVIHGPIASGKLTIARQLVTFTGLPLFHNHLVVDAVLSVFSFGSDEFVRLRDQFWMATFEAAAQADRSLIFTFAPEPTVPPDFINRMITAVEQRGGKVLLVELRVTEAEQDRRIGNSDRHTYGKMTDPDLLTELRRRTAEQPVDLAMPRADLVVDTVTSTPTQSAALIVRGLGLDQRR